MRTTKLKVKKPGSGTAPPAARPGECVLLKAVTVTKAGAFMDRCRERDLLVPVSQQLKPIVEGNSYVVYLFLDPKDQLLGST